jgi:hypothetical protein
VVGGRVGRGIVTVGGRVVGGATVTVGGRVVGVATVGGVGAIDVTVGGAGVGVGELRVVCPAESSAVAVVADTSAPDGTSGTLPPEGAGPSSVVSDAPAASRSAADPLLGLV